MPITKDYPNTDWATKTETTVIPRLIYPFKRWGNTDGYIVERDYIQGRSAYSPATGLGVTTDATYTDAYLFQETKPTSAGTGLVRFTYRFGTVPGDFSVTSFEVITFPGFYESEEAGGSDFRPPQSLLAAVTTARTFVLDTAPEEMTPSDSVFSITKSSSDATIVNYVDDDTVPDYSTYTGWMSDTYYQPMPVKITRAYGAGYIWQEALPQTYAQ